MAGFSDEEKIFRNAVGGRRKEKTERERLVRICCIREGKMGLQINNFAL